MNAFLLLSALVAVCAAAPAPQLLAAPWAHAGLVHAAAPLVRLADDGQYRTGLLDSAIDLRGEYHADDEGAYKPDAEGAYVADDEGAYKPDAEGQYDAPAAHAAEALSEDGSYKGEPVAVAYAAGAPHLAGHHPIAVAAAPAIAASPLAYSALHHGFHPFAYNAFPHAAVIKA